MPVVERRGLRVEVVAVPAEARRFDAMLAGEHWLGAGRAVGDYLRQVVCDTQAQWVALLAWGPAALRLKDRDAQIGWDHARRTTRLRLVVQNRRFLVPEATRELNLASRCLTLAVKALPQQWAARFGYAPLLAETFTDPEAHAGTCYRAAGWLPVGLTAGYARHRADYYVDRQHPKRLWLKELQPQACARLRAHTLAPADAPGAAAPVERMGVLSARHVESLLDALRAVPDPRAQNRSFPLCAVLAIVAMGLMCGRLSLAAIVRFGKELTPAQRQRLCLPPRANGLRRAAPSYKVYYNLLCKLDLDAFAHVLSQWLTAQAGTLPLSLALDGKMVRDLVGTLSLVEHETGAVVAMAPMRHKEGEGGEMTVGQQLLQRTPLPPGSLVTADALHLQKKTTPLSVEQGAEFLIAVKDNQPTLHKRLQTDFVARPPLLPANRNPAMAGS